MLNDSTYILPDDLETIDLGYWSEQMSDENGEFATPIQIIREYNGTYTSTGITITFDTNKEIYATEVNIKWYRDNELLSEQNYTPNSSIYFCQNNVTAYNKIVLTFAKMNMASRYLRVFQIDDGVIRTFFKDEIIGLEILESISDTGNELKINTMNLNLLSKNPVKMLFQKVQALRVYNDSTLYGTFFVDSCERTLNNYKIQTYDLVGMLDNNTYVGGMYNNVQSQDLISAIMKDIPYELDNSLKNISISGYLPIDTCRNLLMQVAFVLNAIVDTTRDDKVRIYPQPTTYVATSLDETRVGMDITETSETPYTAVQVTEHKYLNGTDSTEIYNDVLNGTITITFGEPIRNLSISGGTIVESGTNYAIITGTGGTVTLTGYGYVDQATVKAKYNPQNTSNSIPNVFEITSVGIVNSTNSQAILDRLGNALFNNATIDFSFLLNDEKVGDFVTIPTEEGNKTGQILDVDYELNSSTIWAKAKIREV